MADPQLEKGRVKAKEKRRPPSGKSEENTPPPREQLAMLFLLLVNTMGVRWSYIQRKLKRGGCQSDGGWVGSFSSRAKQETFPFYFAALILGSEQHSKPKKDYASESSVPPGAYYEVGAN